MDAYGQHFELELKANDELIKKLPKAQKRRLKQSMKIYKGRIPGIAGSWARINRHGKRVSGAFWDGNDLYMIDSSDEVGRALADKSATATSKPYPVIYRSSDLQTTATCDVDSEEKAFSTYKSLVKDLESKAQALSSTAKQLNVAIVADAQFTQANSTNPQAAVISRMNVVDGIYSNQVGVHINIAEIRALATNGGLSATNAGTLLNQFQSYTSAGFNNPGLAHLFTGRNMDGSTIGTAYIGVLCSKDLGIGLSETTGTGTAGALTVAHETGHNFGAPHDNQSGSACATTAGGFIMNPYSNGSTTFSSCSLQKMSTNIGRATCLTPVTLKASADVRPSMPVNPVSASVLNPFSYRVEIRNDGSSAAQGVTAAITIPAGITVSSASASSGTCSQAASAVNCTLGSLAAGGLNTITLNAQAGTAATSLISGVQVTASNDSNTGNNTANETINLSSVTGVSVGATVFEANFNADTGGFSYLDDTFMSTSQPNYATGARVISAGSNQLRVVLGGRDNASVWEMSGGWRKSFSLSVAKPVTVTFDYRLDQTPNYEPDTYSDALLSIDGCIVGVNCGSFLSRISGDGNGGPTISSGVKRISVNLGTLAAGTLTLTLGGFNSKKTSYDESTSVFFDNVKVTTAP